MDEDKKQVVSIRLKHSQIIWLKSLPNASKTIRNLIDRAMRQDALSEQWRKTCEEPEVKHE